MLSIAAILAVYMVCLTTGRAIQNVLARSELGNRIMWHIPTFFFGTTIFIVLFLKWVWVIVGDLS
jgi:hypothetical protein